jgi:hypothetical protein
MTRGRLTIVVFGASLLEVDTSSPGVMRVRCPGCGAKQIFVTTGAKGTVLAPPFHLSDDCSVWQRIRSAAQQILDSKEKPE